MSNLVPDPAATAPQTARVVNIANALTCFRLLLVPVFAVLLLHGGGALGGWRIASCAVFAVASITDRIDGDLARSRGIVTDFGKLADPIADKALIGTALVGLSVLHLLPWWVTAVVLARELGITGLRFWVIRRGILPASRGGKVKTFTQAVAIGLYLLPITGWAHWFPVAVMAIAVALTLGTGVDYIARAITLRRTPGAGTAARVDADKTTATRRESRS